MSRLRKILIIIIVSIVVILIGYLVYNYWLSAGGEVEYGERIVL